MYAASISVPPTSKSSRCSQTTRSPTRKIRRADYHAGRTGVPQVFTRLAASEGYPDSTVDADGGLSNWDGGCIVRCDNIEAGSARIGLPPALPTFLALAGPGLERLFVTTARIGLSPESLHRQAQAGGVFARSPGWRGLPDRRFAADLRG